MRLSPIAKILSLATTLSILSGCSSIFHEPEPQPALVKIYGTASRHVLFIEAIDGNYKMPSSVYSITPGRHELLSNISGAKEVPSKRTCSKSIVYTKFEGGKIYELTEGLWNGSPQLMLKSARGEVLATASISDCVI